MGLENFAPLISLFNELTHCYYDRLGVDYHRVSLLFKVKNRRVDEVLSVEVCQIAICKDYVFPIAGEESQLGISITIVPMR
jgi:hypothetical protein